MEIVLFTVFVGVVSLGVVVVYGGGRLKINIKKTEARGIIKRK